VWPLSDALCAALQVINHLQDCAKDYREIDRVYIPADMLARHGGRIEDLGLPTATAGLRAAIVEAAGATQALLRESAGFACAIRSRRLGHEVAVIQRLAEDLTARLLTRDPLSESVHHSKFETALLALRAMVGQLVARGLGGA